MATRQFIAMIAFTAACASAVADSAQKVSAKLEGEQITVSVNGAPFTAYKFSATQKYPYLFPVMGPASGLSVTTETSEPYPHHHSVFFGCDRVNGGNYWQDQNGRGQILSSGPKIESPSEQTAVITDECLWRQPDQEPVIRDARRITITAPSADLRFIDFDITLHMLTDVRIEQTNHSLFSVRMTPELSVLSGGTLRNAEGKLKQDGTDGIESVWCDYFGTRNGITEGVAMFLHPANRWYPSKWETRDYGFFSPTPMQWLDGGFIAFPKGEALQLRYRVVVHRGNTDDAAIADLSKQYADAAATQTKTQP